MTKLIELRTCCQAITAVDIGHEVSCRNQQRGPPAPRIYMHMCQVSETGSWRLVPPAIHGIILSFTCLAHRRGNRNCFGFRPQLSPGEAFSFHINSHDMMHWTRLVSCTHFCLGKGLSLPSLSRSAGLQNPFETSQHAGRNGLGADGSMLRHSTRQTAFRAPKPPSCHGTIQTRDVERGRASGKSLNFYASR